MKFDSFFNFGKHNLIVKLIFQEKLSFILSIENLMYFLDPSVTQQSLQNAEVDPSSSADPSMSRNCVDLCQVCGAIAGRHLAYGGKACLSCRAFFRRSVQTTLYRIFTCKSTSNCLINLRTRKTCKYCRFMKCIGAQMEVGQVLPECERKRKYSTMRQRPVTKSIIMGLDMPFTMEEYLQVEQVRSTFRSLVNLKYENFFANEREGLNHLAQVSYFGGVIQYDFWKKFIDASDLFSQEVMLNLEAMSSLKPEDRFALIRYNALATYSFMESVYTDETDPSLCICLSILHDQRLTVDNPVIRYNSIYASPWAPTADDEMRHRELIAKMKCWVFPNRDLEKGEVGFDSNLMILMRMLISFNTHNVQLNDRNSCERIRDQFSYMLYRYLKKRFDNSVSDRYSQAMEVCAGAFETANILRGRLPV